MNQSLNEILDRIKLVDGGKDFVGIKMVDDKIQLHIPRTLNLGITDKEKRKNIALFLKSLKMGKEDKSQLSGSVDSEDNTEWPIESYLWIINDYLEYGLYFNREKKYYHDNKGKIDWKRTLKNTPLYSNGNFIYTDLVTYRMSASNDIITQVYKRCLFVSVSRIGCIFNYNFNVDDDCRLTKKEMIRCVNKEYESTFDDVKRLRFRHMLLILEELENSGVFNNSSAYGITNNDYVFERMVDKFFKGIPEKELEKYYPTIKWFVDKKTFSKPPLREDTIHINGNNFYIIDSKFYQDNYPGTDSIEKQITYAEFILNYKMKNKDVKVRNTFILPYDKTKGRDHCEQCNENLAYLGYSIANWSKEPRQEHEYILAYCIDYNYLLNNYNRSNSSYIELLMDQIETKLEELTNSK